MSLSHKGQNPEELNPFAVDIEGGKAVHTCTPDNDFDLWRDFELPNFLPKR